MKIEISYGQSSKGPFAQICIPKRDRDYGQPIMQILTISRKQAAILVRMLTSLEPLMGGDGFASEDCPDD